VKWRIRAANRERFQAPKHAGAKMSDKIHEMTDDWEVALIGGVAAARGGGAGMFFSAFRSPRLGVEEVFYLTASGLGLGGNASGVDPMSLKEVQFGKAEVSRPFSVGMLHLSAGCIVSAGVGFPGGWSANTGFARINAGREGVKLFEFGTGFGQSLGSGTGVIAFAGMWFSHRLNNNSANPATAYADGIMKTIHDIAMKIDRGIRDIYMPPRF
jgi:hypothetical protein